MSQYDLQRCYPQDTCSPAWSTSYDQHFFISQNSLIILGTILQHILKCSLIDFFLGK